MNYATKVVRQICRLSFILLHFIRRLTIDREWGNMSDLRFGVADSIANCVFYVVIINVYDLQIPKKK